jgi:NAD(P)-dependent dehydrogenase (short-subunit alcohol dehydrogenase family)
MNTAQTILITGSNSGFGRLTAESLAKRGYTVFAGMRGVEGRNQGAAGELRAFAKASNVHLQVVEIDVTSDASVKAAVTSVLSATGAVDVIINNAGLLAMGYDEAFSDEDAAAIFDVNFFGPQRVNRAALPNMRERGKGLLVHISSSGGRIAFPYMGMYAASKHALEALAVSYRYQLAPFGVDSVLVEPGGFGTPLFDKLLTPSNAACVASYGALADRPLQFLGGFAASLQAPDAPDPQRVADAIVGLIETPAGQRPLRTTIDPQTGEALQALNELDDKVRREVLTAFGAADLLSVKG